MLKKYLMLDNVVDIVRRASELMLTDKFEIKSKHGIENIVTSSDVAVQRFLTQELSALLPGCGFIAEEDDVMNGAHEWVWIIDPIDGTANYSRGISDCCISVALAHNGELELGVVYSPGRGEMFSAQKGKGAFCNGKPIKVSQRDFRSGIMCTAMSTYDKQWAKLCSDIIYDVFMESNDFRRFGSAALELCLMAAGYIELFFEMKLQPWDYAAGGFILLEAGGRITGFDGKLPPLDKPSIICAANCNESCERLLDAIHRHLDAQPY